jgi:hypothetical protein
MQSAVLLNVVAVTVAARRQKLNRFLSSFFRLSSTAVVVVKVDEAEKNRNKILTTFHG